MSIYTSSNLDLTLPTPNGPARVIYPWARYGDRDACVIEQTYRQFVGSWRPAVLNRPIDASALLTGSDWIAPERFGEAVLVEDSEPQPIGGGLVEWTRAWVARPRDELTIDGAAIPYQFPGIADSFGNNYGIRRPLALNAAAVERARWYTVGPGGDYAEPDDIPVDPSFAPTLVGFGEVDFVQDAGAAITATSPNRTTYLSWITLGTDLVASSSLSRWRGNLWQVSRTTVRAR